MRKIGTHEEEAARRKRQAQIFSMGLLAIMVFSTLGYAFFSNPDTGQKTVSNSSVQQIADSQWVFNFGGRQILVTTSPTQARNISFETKPSLADFTQKSVYIDASDSIAATIGSALSPYTSKVQRGCYGNCTEDFSEHDCNDTIIVWKNSDNQQIYKQDNCYFIDGDKRAVDAFLYRIFGIIGS